MLGAVPHAMSNRTPAKFPQDSVSRRASQRWMIAGLAGLSVTGVLGLGGVLDGWPAALTGLATIAGGWGVMLLSAPWRAMRTLGPDARSELAALNEKLHAIIDGDRTIALRGLITLVKTIEGPQNTSSSRVTPS